MERGADGHDVVTGGSGFIGQHLVRALLRQGRKVTIVDLRSPGPLAAARGGRWVEGDIRSREVLERGIGWSAYGAADRLFHLAACTGVRGDVSEAELFDVNVRGTLEVIRVAGERGVRRVVYAGSSSVYGNPELLPTPESAPLRPVSPYGESKLKGEEFVLGASERDTGTSFAVARLFTVYGPGGRAGMAIPTFLERVCSGLPIPLFGSPDSFRDYTGVRDTVRGILLVSEADRLAGPVNIASGRPVRLRDLVEVIGRVVGRRPECRWLPGNPLDVFGTHADITCARRLGYAPGTSLLEGIEEIVRESRLQAPHPRTSPSRRDRTPVSEEQRG